MYQTKFFYLSPLRLIALSCSLLLHSNLVASTLADINQSTLETFNHITNALTSLASAPAISQNSLLSLIGCSISIADKIAEDTSSYDLETIPNVLQSITKTLAILKTSLNNSSLSISPNGFVATSLLSVSNNFKTLLQLTDEDSSFFTDSESNIINSLSSISFIFNAIVNSSSFSAQENFNTAASIAINIVAILDRLTTVFNLTLTSVATNARNSLATFSTLTSGVYVYTAGNATKTKIQTASIPINAYIDELLDAKSIIELSIPTRTYQTHCGDICAGPDGNTWFLDGSNHSISKITPSGIISEYKVAAAPVRICVGSDGALWYTELSTKKIARITTDGANTRYSTPKTTYCMCSGPDGNIWFTEDLNNTISKITLSGTVTEYKIENNANKYKGLCAGPDGNIWVTVPNLSKVCKVTTSGTITEYSIPESAPFSICTGPDGNLWTASTSGIFKITTSGEYTKISSLSFNHICTGPDGNLWATTTKKTILKITPSGDITTYAITSGNKPSFICSGPDGNIWFTLEKVGKIGKIILN